MQTREDTHTSDALALLTLPSLDGLAEAQVRGNGCVWCAIVLTPGTAVDLGPRPIKRAGAESQWFPRGCKSCTAPHALSALHDHAPGCGQCADDSDCCEVGRALIRLTRGRKP